MIPTRLLSYKIAAFHSQTKEASHSVFAQRVFIDPLGGTSTNCISFSCDQKLKFTLADPGCVLFSIRFTYSD